MSRHLTRNSDGASATVAFIDLAGFSAIADVYGDAAAIDVLEIFETKVREALADCEPPIKWIGDEAMLCFPGPEPAIQALGTLLQACRDEPRLPLTRSALNHGPVVRRGNDIFGSTVNVAARIAALAAPGQLLATRPIAEAAEAKGILVQDLGEVALRSVADEVPLYEIGLAPSADPAWIDPSARCMLPMNSIAGPVRKGRGFARPAARRPIASRRRPIRCRGDGQPAARGCGTGAGIKPTRTRKTSETE